MFTQSRFNLLKTAAAALAAASLAACGGGGGSGGGSQQSAGTITVDDSVTIDDVITIEFRDCVSKGFNAKLDSIDITPLFTLDKSDNDKACNARASVYALQGVLGEKAQAEGSSKLLVKVQGRTDIDKSFKFEAWPEFALSYPNYYEIEGEVFNALLTSVTTVSGIDGVVGNEGKAVKFSALSLPETIEAKSTGLTNKFTLALSGEEIKDSTVFQLPTELKESHVISDLLKSYLIVDDNVGVDVDTSTKVTINFVTPCGENTLCPTVSVDNISYKYTVEANSAVDGFNVSIIPAIGMDQDIAESIKKAIELVGSVILADKTADGLDSRVASVELKAPAFVSLTQVTSTSLSYSRKGTFSAEDVSGSAVEKREFADKTKTYIAMSSNSINQHILAEYLVGGLNQDGAIPLCEETSSGLKCDLRDELLKLAIPVAEEMAQAIGPVSATEARGLVEGILPKNKNLKIEYQVEFTGAAPYIRYLSNQLELSAYDVRLQLALSPDVNSNKVCADVFKDIVRLPICQANMPSGKYAVLLGDLFLKQRLLRDKESGKFETSKLVQTSLHANEFAVTEGGKIKYYSALAGTVDANDKFIARVGLEKSEVLPIFYNLLGELPMDKIGGFNLSDLSGSDSKLDISCNTDHDDKLQQIFGDDGKKVSFKDLNIATDKHDASVNGTQEAKHLVLSGDMVLTQSGKADLTIAYKPCP